jgi:hypothetical protein
MTVANDRLGSAAVRKLTMNILAKATGALMVTVIAAIAANVSLAYFGLRFPRQFMLVSLASLLPWIVLLGLTHTKLFSTRPLLPCTLSACVAELISMWLSGARSAVGVQTLFGLMPVYFAIYIAGPPAVAFLLLRRRP